jgi:hypothetical protein
MNPQDTTVVNQATERLEFPSNQPVSSPQAPKRNRLLIRLIGIEIILGIVVILMLAGILPRQFKKVNSYPE